MSQMNNNIPHSPTPGIDFQKDLGRTSPRRYKKPLARPKLRLVLNICEIHPWFCMIYRLARDKMCNCYHSPNLCFLPKAAYSDELRKS